MKYRTKQSGNAKVFIVDDSPTTLQFVSQALKKKGYLVETSTDIWVSALIQKAKPNLILMDLNIGRVKNKGLHAVKTLKKQIAKNIPIVLYSSVPASEMAQLALQGGADGYICKSNDEAKLILEIRKYLR